MFGIGRSGCCPHCGTQAITFRKSMFLTLWAQWPCSACGLTLGVSSGRRIIVASVGGVLMGLSFFSLMHHNWVRLGLLVIALVYVWTFDKVVIVSKEPKK